MVGLQKPLHKGIEIEEEKLWKEEYINFNIYVIEAVAFHFCVIISPAQLTENHFLLLFLLSSIHTPGSSNVLE